MYDEIQDTRERVIKKAAHILGGLAWHQYLNGTNKETSTRIAIYYLRKNGFDLPLDSLQEQKELFHLLVRTIEKFPQDQTIYRDRGVSKKKSYFAFLKTEGSSWAKASNSFANLTV